MCGLFGFSKLDEKTRDMARFLAYSMENRGGDSWGASNGADVIKEVGAISNGFFIPPHWREGIFHTRGASVGAVCKRNAHPFLVERDGRRVIGMHNGGVLNYEFLNSRYNRHCEVDSEHIFHHLAEHKPMGELIGKGTIIWYDIYEGAQTVHLARWNFGDLEVAKLKDGGGIVFCSTREPIERAARLCGLKIEHFYEKLVDGYWHVIDGKGTLRKGEDLGFNAGNYSYIDSRSSTANKSIHSIADGWAYCRRCHCQQTKDVLCHGCWKIQRSNFEALQKGSIVDKLLNGAVTVN